MKAVTPFSTCRRALVLCVCGTFWITVGTGGECMYVCV